MSDDLEPAEWMLREMSRATPNYPVLRLTDFAQDSDPIQEHPRQNEATERTTVAHLQGGASDGEVLREEDTPLHGSAPASATPSGTRLESNLKQYFSAWFLSLYTLVFSVFSMWYIYVVLINRDPVPRRLRLSPANTVLVVQVIAHLLSFKTWQLLCIAYEMLRWALASRADGVPAPTFFILSRATPNLSTMLLLSHNARHSLWCIQRLDSFLAVSDIAVANCLLK